jgi:hypothetical protein
MTDETPTGRDTSGRFVKRAVETVNAMSRTNDEGIHPMSKVLFGWTETKNIGAILFWVLAVLSIILVLASFVVLMGWPLGRLLRRDENYYGDAGGPPDDIDPGLDGKPLGGGHAPHGGEH